ncbi:MAG: hypothetical protein Fur002_02130 [Anaerolineales bacterium]
MNKSFQPSETQRFGFWASLPLSRKLLISFGALFLLAALIAVVALFGLNRTSAAYEDTLAQGITVRGTSDQLTIQLLSARRDGKDYLLRWHEQGTDAAYANYATLFLKNVSDMRETVKLLAPFGSEAPTASTGAISQAQYEADLAVLNEQIDAYQQSFLSYVEVTKTRGSDENTGLEGQMRTAAHNLELKINGVAGLEQLEITLLQLRRAEKDYINRGDETYVNKVHTLVPQLKTQIAAADQLPSAAKTELRAQLDSYLKAFDAIVEADKQLIIHDSELADVALALQNSIAKIEALGETLAADDVNAAHANSTQTFTFSIVTAFLALAVSVALAVTISRQLSAPIISLTNTAQEISGGKFDVQAQVTSADEIGTLAGTFNIMTARLGQAFAEVNRRAAELATVAEVGTATATILQTDRLLQEVVDLTKERFNLYHSHIYLLDEAGENLVLAMGAGEAGAQMKAQGFSIPLNREQSLVARAARERKGVTVNDVTQAPDFLPNPLLPNTRSELAVPMIVGGKVIGVFDVQSDQVGRFGESDVNIQTTLAAQVATSIQNVRSFEESKTRAELEALVNYLGQRIQRAGTVEETLQIALQEVSQVLGAERALVTLSAQDENPAQA